MGEEKEKERYQCVVVSHMPAPQHQGPSPQPKHVPQLGTEPATLWFEAWAQSTEPHQPGPVLVISLIHT